VEVGLRAGYAFGLGDAARSSPMSASLAGEVPLELDVGYRVLQRLTVGVYASYGPVLVGSVCGGNSCSGSVVATGVGATYSFDRLLGLAPWAGVFFGYEWASYHAGSGSDHLDVSLRGFDFLGLEGGADYPLGEHFAVGPFLSLSLGSYANLSVASPLGEVSGGVPSPSTHLWLGIGVRGTYGS